MFVFRFRLLDCHRIVLDSLSLFQIALVILAVVVAYILYTFISTVLPSFFPATDVGNITLGANLLKMLVSGSVLITLFLLSFPSMDQMKEHGLVCIDLAQLKS